MDERLYEGDAYLLMPETCCPSALVMRMSMSFVCLHARVLRDRDGVREAEMLEQPEGGGVERQIIN